MGIPSFAQNKEKLSAGAIVADAATKKNEQQSLLQVGAERMEEYLPMLQGKRVALLVNQTSRAGSALLPDTLLRRGVRVVKLFVPEHGFRGTADAGAHVASVNDPATRLPIVSLYGANKKPTVEQMKDVDVLVYDLQDVGARFYTYISTLQYAMEACAERGVPVIVLDRPNPCGRAVGGPVLDTALRSFVGMQPVPILYGMTVGEYARMLVGERWLRGAGKMQLTVVPFEGHDARQTYVPPVPPSPNLCTGNAIQNYAWMCLFEGTVVSVGRGTSLPFGQWGHPAFKGMGKDTFLPRSIIGATKPVLEGTVCYGQKIYCCGFTTPEDAEKESKNGPVNLTAIILAYKWFPDKSIFFNAFFEKLAGRRELRGQIQSGMTAQQIAATWKKELVEFRKVRKKYLMYPDIGE